MIRDDTVLSINLKKIFRIANWYHLVTVHVAMEHFERT